MSVGGGAEVTLNHLIIAHGSAGEGGGILNNGTLIVRNTTFSLNSAGGSRQGGGSGIWNNGTLTVINSTFSGNSTVYYGGGINNNGRELTVTNSTFSGNRGGVGGGIINIGGRLTVTNSTFSGGTTTGGFGGGIYSNATLIVTNSTFSGNGESGIFIYSGTLTVTNSTFSGNRGGGIWNNGMLIVTNSTFSGNVSEAQFGGGIFKNGGSVAVKSTILADNSGGNCSGGVPTDAGYNISDDVTCGFAKTGSANNGDGVNPLLSPAGLADNGGPTQTIAPLAGSPAIDAIPLADCTDQASPPNPITIDQRGFKRPDGGEQVCDIGAYEFQDLFAGQPGAADCRSNSIAALAQQFGSLRAAAKALHFRRVKRLRRAVREFCAG